MDKNSEMIETWLIFNLVDIGNALNEEAMKERNIMREIVNTNFIKILSFTQGS